MKHRSIRSAIRRPSRDRKSRRNVVVLATLLGSLVGTSLLLIALAPAPLTPEEPAVLVAISESASYDRIFATTARVQEGRWTQIYIHQSKTPGGNSATLGWEDGMGDHFLIGNGVGCGDGEVQLGHRWDLQRAARPAGAQVSDACISICLVGDLDTSPPTAAQLGQLEMLIRTLQKRLHIAGRDVVVMGQPGTRAGIGAKFPLDELNRAVLP